MAKTLEITGNEKIAWEILGELAGAYGDNGGDPDGNAWLPSDTITEEKATNVIAAGFGKMVDVLYANDDAMLRHLGFAPTNEELEEETIARMKEAANATGWAHYGAYGAGDSLWVFVPRG